MPQDPRKRQKALAKKATQQKQRHLAVRREQHVARLMQSGSRELLRAASGWPVLEVLISASWEDPSQITQVLVARQSPQGWVAGAVILVDRACLGVKNAFGRLFQTRQEYASDLKDPIESTQPMVKADLNLGAKVIRESIAYARELGFEPHPDYYDAALVLAGARPEDCPLPVRVGGADGKPLYVSGPDDNVRAILAKLTRKLGPDGFHYLLQIPEDDAGMLDEDLT